MTGEGTVILSAAKNPSALLENPQKRKLCVDVIPARAHLTLDVRQFIGIRYKTNGLDLSCLYVNGQHGQRFLACTGDKCGLPVDFGKFRVRVCR